MSNFSTIHITQREFLLMSFFESIKTCNVLKIYWVANVNNFSTTFYSNCHLCHHVPMRDTKIFLFLQLLEKMYWKCVSLLMHFWFLLFFFYIFLTTKLVYPIQKTTNFLLSHVFATTKSNLFLCTFFLAYIRII